jgi:arabinofuranosyltransferase
VFAAWRVAASGWLCDDSFICFRYVQNLLGGQGLVYNPGERVEGYTSLLWTVGLAGLVSAGLRPEAAALAFGAASYLLLVGLLLGWWLAHRDEGPELPVAAALVLALDDFHVWATGGLETSTFAALALGGLLLARARRPSTGSDLAAGGVLGLTVLTRPDGALFALAGLTCPWWAPEPATRKARLGRTLLMLCPAAVLVGLQVLFKLSYYGELMPTAFYSKSALEAYYSQGLVYVGLWFAKNWVVLPVALLALLGSWRRPDGGRPRADAAFFAACGLVFAVYVAHSGGDFMFARRLVPALPLLFLGLEHALARLERGRQRLLTAALLAGALFPFPLYGPARDRISGIADEPRFYPPHAIALRRDQGRLVGGLLRGTRGRVMFEGGMCSFGYYSGLPYLVEMTGLTQYSLARLPLARRGLVGHEKSPDAAWLDANGVNLIVSKAFPVAAGPGGPRPDEVYFGSLARARVWRYSDEVMDRLRGQPGVTFVPIERVLETARKDLANGSRAEARRVYDYLDGYYFRSGGPRAAADRQEFRALLEARLAEPRP